MKRNYMDWNYVSRNYTKLNGEQTTKITPIRTANGFIFKVVEVIYLDNQKIYIGFYANRLGKAISNIKNSYFDFQDSKEVYNAMGPIRYKMDLLSRIEGSLKRKQNFQDELETTRR